MLEPCRQVRRQQADPRRQRLRPVVVIERGQLAPERVAAGQLDHPRLEHQPEKEPPQQPAANRGRRRFILRARPPPPGGPQRRQQTRFQQQRVPLVAHEPLAGDREREIESPAAEQRRPGRDPQAGQNRQRHPRQALTDKHRIARADPRQRRDGAPRPRPQHSACPLEILADGQHAIGSDQSAHLNQQGGERDEKDERHAAQDHPARQPPAPGDRAPALKAARQPVHQRAVPGDPGVEPLTGGPHAGHATINGVGPAQAADGIGAQDRFGAAGGPADQRRVVAGAGGGRVGRCGAGFRLDQMDGLGQPAARLRGVCVNRLAALRHLLERPVNDPLAGPVPDQLDRVTAETALAVINHDGAARRLGGGVVGQRPVPDGGVSRSV
ncbi:MAG: hypothetical protein BWZ08_00249 [candidate division BRC1 bacterium ADurb.BinA292]|nr:MAG: hypothetical protein BWZ08_00249 [candidate division BRC1 bacterium ADurb.BinA292]